MAYERNDRGGISQNRKNAYYGGLLLIVTGFVVFVAGGFSAVLGSGPLTPGPGSFEAIQDRGSSMMRNGLIGMALIVAGALLRSYGARGAAGSGMVLNPRQARRDLEPYSRMAGGMLKDALDEAELGRGREAAPEKVVMLRCRACEKLNEEDSKFCQECGQPI